MNRLNAIATPIKTALSHPFLSAVSVFALIHSSWAFSTMFNGIEPDMGNNGLWLAWRIPGAIMAFANDVGLLSIANQIRAGQRTRGKKAAFIILCITMAYAQFIFIATHIPKISLGPGVRADWIDAVQFVIDLALWFWPCLLPIGLSVFTFSENRAPGDKLIEVSSENDVKIDNALTVADPEIKPMRDGSWLAECSVCGKAKLVKTQKDAQRALAGHRKMHAPKPVMVVESAAISPNGHGKHVIIAGDEQ